MSGSPLGNYAAPAAALASLSIIGAALFGLIFGANLGMTEAAQNQLNLLAALAAGALFGSSVAVNGYKAPLEAAHRRTDELERKVTANTAAIVTVGDGKAAEVLQAMQAATAVSVSSQAVQANTAAI